MQPENVEYLQGWGNEICNVTFSEGVDLKSACLNMFGKEDAGVHETIEDESFCELLECLVQYKNLLYDTTNSI